MGFKHSKRSHKPTVVRGSFFPIWGGRYTYFWLAWLWLPASLPRNVHPQFVEKTLSLTCCSWHLAWATLPRLSSHHQTSIVFWRIQVILVSLSNKVQTQWFSHFYIWSIHLVLMKPIIIQQHLLIENVPLLNHSYHCFKKQRLSGWTKVYRSLGWTALYCTQKPLFWGKTTFLSAFFGLLTQLCTS